MRRYEILLPLRFNDGNLISDAVIGAALTVLRKRFRALSCETQMIRGVWQYAGQEHRDELTRVFVDVVDTAEKRAWFVQFKEHLKTEFRQADIWMTTYPIEVV